MSNSGLGLTLKKGLLSYWGKLSLSDVQIQETSHRTSKNEDWQGPSTDQESRVNEIRANKILVSTLCVVNPPATYRNFCGWWLLNSPMEGLRGVRDKQPYSKRKQFSRGASNQSSAMWK